MPEPEVWRTIPSVSGLLASSRGRIMVIPFLGQGGTKHYGGRARTGSWDGDRYIFQWRRHSYKVARLVCEAFHGPPTADRPVCMHLDENARNNDPTNLKWGTQKENLNAPGFISYCKGRVGENSPAVKGKRIANAA
jgi:hypothetical protein